MADGADSGKLSHPRLLKPGRGVEKLMKIREIPGLNAYRIAASGRHLIHSVLIHVKMPLSNSIQLNLRRPPDQIAGGCLIEKIYARAISE